MKKALLLVSVCVVMLLAIPAVVSAENTTAVMVNGSVSGYMSISVSNPTVNFGAMSNATPSIATNQVNVSTNMVPWTVTAQSPNYVWSGIFKGYMTDQPNPYSYPTRLIAIPFQIGKDGVVYSNLRTDYTDFMSGWGSGTYNQPVYFKQEVPQDALVGNYSITVEFIGSAA